MARETVKYIAVRDHLQQRLESMAVGEQIPTEPTLCEEYNVSRITVRRAVDDLIQSGLLERVQGRGHSSPSRSTPRRSTRPSPNV
ncbi:GntR family transcriptional regulator [Corynebacterium sp. CNJ-954]|uniref:GntR family transcriptional regulator n=1 Tax=Corynebacterium sp. CNJ-954 TaxID=1904962 RepID=UPI001301733D|nr:GntR family transcriptional regulator [Corynebacterium sp. CNJ-954]